MSTELVWGPITNLTGLLFHILDEDHNKYAVYQGIIVGEIADRVLYRTFNWIDGGHSLQIKTASYQEVLCGKWVFYSNNEDMAEAYERGGLRMPDGEVFKKGTVNAKGT